MSRFVVEPADQPWKFVARDTMGMYPAVTYGGYHAQRDANKYANRMNNLMEPCKNNNDTMDAATACLAYALFDADSTSRLGEHPEAEAEYFAKAERLLYMIREYRSQSEWDMLAAAIQQR